jgi:four helix bundle protein
MQNHKKLKVWQRADELALEIYRVTERFPQKEAYGITSQIRRAALSVPTNIVEGYGRNSKKELSRFLDIALGSLAETEYLLEFSEKLGYTKQDITHVYSLITEVSKLLWGFKKSL